MSKIDVEMLLLKLQNYSYAELGMQTGPKISRKEVMQQLRALVDEVIGEDDGRLVQFDYQGEDIVRFSQEKLRASQRQRADELFGETKGSFDTYLEEKLKDPTFKAAFDKANEDRT